MVIDGRHVCIVAMLQRGAKLRLGAYGSFFRTCRADAVTVAGNLTKPLEIECAGSSREDQILIDRLSIHRFLQNTRIFRTTSLQTVVQRSR